MRAKKSIHTGKGSGKKKRLLGKRKTRLTQNNQKTRRRKTEQFHSHIAAILEATVDFIGYADAKTKQILYINKAGRKMVGIGEREDVTKLKVSDIHPGWTNRMFSDEIFPAAMREDVWYGECAFLRKNGLEIPVLMALMAHKNKKGEVKTFSTISRDISERIRMEEELKAFAKALEERVRERTSALEKANKELQRENKLRKETEKALKESEHFYRTLIENAPDAIFLMDNDLQVIACNKQVAIMHGFESPEEFIGKTVSDLVGPDGSLRLQRGWREIMETGSLRNAEFKGKKKDGERFPAEINVNLLRDSEGNPTSQIAIVRDVTKQKRTSEGLSWLSAAVNQSINVIYITDTNGQIEYVNSSFENITGYSSTEAIGQNPRILKSGEASVSVYKELWNTILAGKTWRGTLKNKKKNGQYYYCDSVISPIRNEKGQITHFLNVQEDITEKVELRKDASFAASYATFDGLTGLYNRTRFMELLEEWIDRAKAHNYMGAMLLIDIDRFRQINDTYGSKTGDDLLKRIADFLKDSIAEIDMQFFLKASDREVMESLLCRMGGDEFAVFLPSRTECEVTESADEIRKKLESFQFWDWTGHITISVGIVMYPMHGVTLYDLLKKVDAAIFSAKELGRNRVRLYQPEDMVLEKMHAGLEWKGRIQKAIRDNRIESWYQPILELKTDTIKHYEALVRMRSEDMSIVQPGEFLSTAETLGLIMDIDRVVIEKTLQYKQKLIKEGIDFYFSLNLSAKDLDDRGFKKFLMEKVTALQEDAGYLIFEITETTAVHELDTAVKFIRELKTTGCKFSLDDFGVGFTSFRYLQEMDLDYIKIDGTFITKLTESRNDRLFVKSMVDVAHGLGMETVAEFVETRETIEVLRELGVDYAQGYFIGKPAPEIL